MTLRSPVTRWHRSLFASCAAFLIACGSSSTDGGGASGTGGSGSGGISGTGGSTASGTGGGSPGGASGTGGSTDHCSGNLSSTDANAYAAKLKLTDNQISGWKQDTSSSSAFEVLIADKLDCKIDGAAPDYVKRGLRWAMYQDLVGPNDQVCRLVAMDFGTAANATSMVQAQQELTAAEIEIPPYDAGTAIASEVIGGISVYAHFGSSYFEVQLGGFSDQSSATQAAATFLGVLKGKASP